jgi:hypothetical protein
MAERRVLEAPQTTPVQRRPKREGSNENMFVRPDEVKEDDDRGRRRRR